LLTVFTGRQRQQHTFLLQLAHGFAHRGAAQIEPDRPFAVFQTLPGLDLAFDDHVPQKIVDLIEQMRAFCQGVSNVHITFQAFGFRMRDHNLTLGP
jgi:hypothetical protein